MTVIKRTGTAANEMAEGYGIENLESHYTPEPNSGCWLWTGAYTNKGYGVAWLKKKPCTAHRLSWVMHNRPLLLGECVLHSCDNPACINPDHLRAGSHQDNMNDRESRGRGRRQLGAANNKAKLTPEQVREIRASPIGQTTLGRMYGVSQAAIWYIKRGRNWAHLKDDCK